MTPIKYTETEYGFEYGAANVKRICSGEQWIVLGVESQKMGIHIYVTKTGKIRVFDVPEGAEWKRPETKQ